MAVIPSLFMLFQMGERFKCSALAFRSFVVSLISFSFPLCVTPKHILFLHPRSSLFLSLRYYHMPMPSRGTRPPLMRLVF